MPFRAESEVQILRGPVSASAQSRGTSPHPVEPMTSRSRMVTILAVLAFVAFLLYSTMSSQRYQCTVTVDFQGGRQTATASAATENAAAEQAQTAACGPLARGMDESIGCGRRPPVSRSCRTL